MQPDDLTTNDGQPQKTSDYWRGRKLLELYTRAKGLPKSPERTSKMVAAWRLYNQLIPEAIRAEVQQDFANQKTGPFTRQGPIKVGRRVDLMAKSPDGSSELFIKVTICGSGYYIWQTDDEMRQAIGNKKEWEKWLQSELSSGGWNEIGGDEKGWRRDNPGGKGYELMFQGTLANLHLHKKMVPVGMADMGDNSIAGLRAAAVREVQAILADEQGRLSKNKDRPIRILVRAHSRGAVAATNVVNDLNGLPNCKVELVAFDPVPGPDNLVRESNKRQEKKERKAGLQQRTQFDEISVGGLDDSTIIYSIASGHREDLKNIFGMSEANFTPQKVLGSKRFIITQQQHTAGLKSGFIFEGRLYNGSSINSLPTGIYVDRNEPDQTEMKLERLDSVEFTKKVDDALSDLEEAARFNRGVRPDADRITIIQKVLEDYYK